MSLRVTFRLLAALLSLSLLAACGAERESDLSEKLARAEAAARRAEKAATTAEAAARAAGSATQAAGVVEEDDASGDDASGDPGPEPAEAAPGGGE